MVLSIDIETYSDVDLRKCGVYKYASSPNFEILLFGYSVNDGDVKVIDLACGEEMPDEIIEMLTDDTVIKTAHNAAFERVCLSYWLERRGVINDFLNPESWRCTMVLSAYNGLPFSLEQVGSVLGFNKQKMSEGKDLIRYFCVPCKATKTNGGRTRNMPSDAYDRWETFRKYNIRDVEVENQIRRRLDKYPVPDSVWAEYAQNEEINDRGIGIDLALVENAIRIDAITKSDLTDELRTRTDLENPNSVVQMKAWLADNGLETESLGKKQVAELMKDATPEMKEVLQLRAQLAKTSVKKYQAMQNAVCDDGRCHGMFQFYGANRTGRFSGRIVQLQNLPQNHMPDLAQARELLKSGNYEALQLLYPNVPLVLSELIRTAFVPADGYKFVVADFSAIEARVLAWLAGEKWVLDTFIKGGDIYCETASRMFHKKVEKHGENSELRQKGKQATLSCGYGGSVGALKAMGAIESGMVEDELKPLVDAWRRANPNIVRYWWDVDAAVKRAVEARTTVKIGDITFSCQKGMLFITLPSGRRLSYVKPRVELNAFGGESVTYMGLGTNKKWERLESYGPKFVENIVQGIARDLLCYSMQTLSFCNIVGHIHDEVIIECSKAVAVDKICELMGRTPDWAKGLPLRADGYETAFYKKE